MKKIVLVVIVIVLQSCNSVKEYEKVNINDPEMKFVPKLQNGMKLLFKCIEKLRLEPMEVNLVEVAVVINFLVAKNLRC